MSFTLPIYLGWRFSKGGTGDRFSRFISRLSMFGIILGVAALIIVSSVMNGFEARLKQDLLSVLPHAIVTHDSIGNKNNSDSVMLNEKQSQLNRLNGDEVELVTKNKLLSEPVAKINWSKFSDITDHYQVVDGDTILQSATAIGAGWLLGVRHFSEVALAPYLIQGRFDSLDESGAFHLIIGDGLARQLNVKLGDKLRVMVTSASTFTPLGRIPRQRLFTITGLFATYTDVDLQLMYTNLEDGSRLLAKDLHAQQSYQLTFNDPFIVPQYQPILENQGWQWRDWRVQRGTLFQAVKMEKNMMSIMLSLIIFIAVFNVISSLIMVVMDKQKEIAILKTLGLTRKRIMAIFIVQGGYSGVFGAIFGGVLGVVMAIYINTILSFFNVGFVNSLGGTLPVLINPIQVMLIIVMAMFLTLLVTIYPSYRAASFQPAQVLRYE